MRSAPRVWKAMKFLFNKESIIDESDGKVKYMRYMLNFGAPLDMSSKQSLKDDGEKGQRYRDYTDRNSEQKAYVNEF